jgi:hypothetical protein
MGEKISFVNNNVPAANDASFDQESKTILFERLTPAQKEQLMALIDSIKASGAPSERSMRDQREIISTWSDDEVIHFFVSKTQDLMSKPALALALIGRILGW